MTRYEIQVLESVVNVTYADGQAAAIYGQWPPLVNASRPAGEWNVYDIFFEAPKFEGAKLVKPAYVTVVHNGVMVHHRQEIIGAAVHRRVAVYTPHGGGAAQFAGSRPARPLPEHLGAPPGGVRPAIAGWPSRCFDPADARCRMPLF